ncbi:MAG TPA: glycoside hydrolase family 3 N-terminal domain-containing protein [Terriglobia bacterium]|nr:glycoside hydrolase family 3 N-terminal domain-containing protein [Terriglobia bacterium]
MTREKMIVKITRYLSVAFLVLVSLPAQAQLPLTAPQQAWVDKTLAGMTLEEKIGAVMFPVTSGGFINLDSDAFQQIKDNIQKFHVGGYHIEGFSGGDPASGALLIAHMQALAKIPLLITADFEGGAGSEFDGATRFPRGMAMGATGDPHYAYDAAKLTAQEAKAMGITVNFYPVVDVNDNPANPIINVRSFGEDPQRVGEFGAAYVRGTQDQHVIATLKHFPGHGDTSVDSHLELPVLNFDRARLDQVELPPFEAAIKAGAGAVMTAHIYLPQFEKTPGVPASLSRALTTGLLRNDLGFKGLIFTDALPMHAISSNFGAEQAPVMAIEAGADVALEPEDVPKTFAALQAAVSKGDITEERLNQSVRRLLEAKAWAGLDTPHSIPLDQLDKLVSSRAAQEKSQEIMEHALTLVKDDANTLPLHLSDDEQVLLVNFVDSSNPENPGYSGLTFRAEFLKRHPKTVFTTVTPAISMSESALIKELADTYQTVVVSCSIRIASYKGAIGLNDAQQNLLRALAGHKGPFVFALFGSPYLLNYIPELPSYALAYDFYPGAETAMVRAIFGEINFTGQLPVTVGPYPIGFRLMK